jgi:PAS domain S-box-containing protein
VTPDDGLLEESAEDLFENAPCGYLSTRMDGTLVKVNRTFETWTGFSRGELLGTRRLPDLLSAGGRIYYDTHVAPLLLMQGFASEIAVEFVRADGSRLPALINATLRTDEHGRPGIVRTTVFDATDRRRYEQELVSARRKEQEIAQRLQLSLLSGVPPQADGLRIEVAYRTGVRGTEVGGDWYDAFWLTEGESVGLVVGDVVGRGLDAAATMGQLRSAVRALASTGLAPGPLLDALDRFACLHGVGRMATIVYAQLDLASGELRYACAGHLPPILVGPAGEPPRAVWEGRSTPLDAYRGVRACPRAEATCRLAPGTFVLLYTDGLVERRAESIDDGIDRLLNALSEHGERDPAALLGALVRGLRDPASTDDVCLLLARVARPGD